MSQELARFTTEYIETEDRLRLAGEDGAGVTVVIWLTQRLLQRLVPLLLRWLAQEGEAGSQAEVWQGWAQQAARAELAPQAPVVAAAPGWAVLAQEVDLTPGPEAVVFLFKGGGGERASIALRPVHLRQWLNILYDNYLLAGWPMELWPEWFRAEGGAAAEAGVVH